MGETARTADRSSAAFSVYALADPATAATVVPAAGRGTEALEATAGTGAGFPYTLRNRCSPSTPVASSPRWTEELRLREAYRASRERVAPEDA